VTSPSVSRQKVNFDFLFRERDLNTGVSASSPLTNYTTPTFGCVTFLLLLLLRPKSERRSQRNRKRQVEKSAAFAGFFLFDFLFSLNFV